MKGKDVVYLIMCVACVAGLTWLHEVVNEKHSHQIKDAKECRLGGIYVGMPIHEAETKLNHRAKKMKGFVTLEGDSALVKYHRGDSVGYIYKPLNEEFYVKQKGGRVYYIHFHSNQDVSKGSTNILKDSLHFNEVVCKGAVRVIRNEGAYTLYNRKAMGEEDTLHHSGK